MSNLHADNPANWLVVYNTASSDSITWMAEYGGLRGIPMANRLGLVLPTTEEMSSAEYGSMQAAVSSYLSSTGLNSEVLGILLGHGVPGYALFSGSRESVPGLMQVAGDQLGAVFNPLYAPHVLTRPTSANLSGARLTARIDGENLASSRSLVERATTLMSEGLGDGEEAGLWLDPWTQAGVLTTPLMEAMGEWMRSLEVRKLRLPVQWTAEHNPPGEVNFAQIARDGFYWGWTLAEPPVDFFAAPAGKRVMSVSLDHVTGTGTSVRTSGLNQWTSRAVAAGYAAVAGTSRGYSLTGWPGANLFFEAIRLGWTVAEAWFCALPLLRESWFLLGDPLLKVQVPKAGWEVWGPLLRLEDMAEEPTAKLRDVERSWSVPTSSQPMEGARARYVVRRVDEAGRLERGCKTVGVHKVNGQAVEEVWLPIWPGGEGWPIAVENNQLVIDALWEKALGSLGIMQVELLGEIDGAGESVLASWDETMLGSQVTELSHVRAMPGVSARFRWRITGRRREGVISRERRVHVEESVVGLGLLERVLEGGGLDMEAKLMQRAGVGAVVYSAWSQWVKPVAVLDVTLQTVA